MCPYPWQLRWCGIHWSNQVPEALQRPTKKRNRRISDKKRSQSFGLMFEFEKLEMFTHPKCKSVPLKNGGWKTILPYWGPVIFQGPMLNFGNVFRRFHRVETSPKKFPATLKVNSFPCRCKADGSCCAWGSPGEIFENSLAQRPCEQGPNKGNKPRFVG